MAKIKFTKGELKRQRDGLKQFRHFLPTLQLKKQQLQMKVLETRKLFKQKRNDFEQKQEYIEQWVGLLGDPGLDIKKWIIPTKIILDLQNIAGANVPVFKEVIYRRADYDYFIMPFWVDEGIKELKVWGQFLIEMNTIAKQLEILEHELRVTTQRVNLFEKIKIPEAIENIRRIRIYLGDLQANAVGISKVAKKKIEMMELV